MNGLTRFLINWATTTFALFVAIWIVPGISVQGGAYAAPILTALVLAILTQFLTPVLQLISLPLTCLTFGIFALIVNTIVLELASALTRGIFMQGIVIDSFLSAFFGALIISLVSALLYDVIID